MSSLFLIRHGQASFGAADYDVLSERGATQSRRLGAYLAGRAQHFDAIYVGPRVRQRDTAIHLRAAASEHGVAYPEPIHLDGLDEYPAFELLKYWMPILTREDPDLQAILAGAEGQTGYERAFEHIIGKWVRGELDTGSLESFAQFIARVRDTLTHIMTEQGRGKQVAVVTSGGPISAAVRWTLGLADDTMLRLAWVIANASYSEFRYRADDLSLLSFNSTPHLHDEALLTYR
ncbi:MAG TPA: histidine phosphatase family protein [Kofleriaceae bacterium]|nr:histidine phosphatase family protein [Kofleriaceae bacterium]